jgi:hypothetical protein
MFSFTKALVLNDPGRLGGTVLIRKLEEELLKAKANDLEVRAEGLYFRGGPFRLVSNWNLLVAIDYGFVSAETKDAVVCVRYKLAFARILAITLVFSACVALFAYYVAASAVQAIVLFFLGLVWLGGGNIVLATVRFRQMICRSWRKSQAQTG